MKRNSVTRTSTVTHKKGWGTGKINMVYCGIYHKGFKKKSNALWPITVSSFSEQVLLPKKVDYNDG